MVGHDILFWLIFAVVVVVMLFLDLGVFGKKEHTIKPTEALIRSGIWILVALLFNLGIYHVYGHERALKFLAGYVVEKSLSVDNIFVFIIIFKYFKIPTTHQHKVLFWGIFGAVFIRAVFIVLGLALIQQFHWVIYVMAIFLIITGFKLAFEKDKEIHPEHNPILKFLKKFIPLTHELKDGRFFIQQAGKRLATPLFVALIVVETTDIIFAVDSIPAILAITTDPFIVYTSNVFAILGLRSLYFALAGLMEMFYYLHYGLAFILVFVGLKMLKLIHLPIEIALGVIVGILSLSMAASMIRIKLKKG